MVSITGDLDGKIKISTCRICLDSNAADMVLLNDDNGGLKNFEYCFGITLTTKDEPRLLCKLCADSVQNYVQFKKKCEKSHVLWQSVISNVKCSIAKHKTLENSNKMFDDCITQNTEIINSTFDTSVDNNLNNLNGNKSNLLTHLLNTEIKLESDEEQYCIYEDEIKSENNESADKRDFSILDIKDCLDTNDLDLELRNSDDSNSRCGSSKVKMFSCKKCNRKYKRKTYYQNHLKICKPAKTKQTKKLKDINYDYAYDCGRNYNCDNNSKNKNECNIGDSFKEISESQTKGQYLCGLCQQSFSNTGGLYQHLNEHWSSNCLTCGLCDFVGIDLAAIVAHRYSHYPRSDNMRFKCHICKYINVSLLALHFHYRSRHLKKVGGYCSRCNKEYTTLRKWKIHEQNSHNSPKFICDYCEKRFYYKSNLKDHIMTHMRTVICDICGNNFTREKSLKGHIERLHKARPLKCNHCDKMFKNEIVLKKHLRNIKMEKAFKCTLCGKGFRLPCLLQEHMNWHSDERPFFCEICGASYKAKCQLTVHMRKHTGVFPYKCTQCTKAFASSTQLKTHSSVHTGVRRHCCVAPNCGRTFHSRKLMLAHLALRHKEFKLQDGLQSEDRI